MKIVYDKAYDYLDNKNDMSRVFQVFPDVYGDNRGYFTEVLKDSGQWPKDNMPLWFSSINWIRQINRSASKGGTIRGCHAQTGSFCQGKLVEALSTKIYDIITDARPDSKSFGLTTAYVLDPVKQNKLWVPRGFLHAFAVPFTDTTAVFLYFCDNTFYKKSETGVNPMSLIPEVVRLMKQYNPNADGQFNDLYTLFDDVSKLSLSDKDCNAEEYGKWMEARRDEYQHHNKLWYK